MELVLICIALLFGKSLQDLNSDEFDKILDKLLNQIKNNTTSEVDNVPSNALNMKSPDESKIYYIRTYSNPIVDFVPNNISGSTDVSQKYIDANDNPKVSESSQKINTINDDKTIFKDDFSGIPSENDNIPNNERNIESHNKFNEPENSSNVNILLPKSDDDQQSINEFRIPDEVLNLIKENHKNGNILKEIVVEIDSNIITNPTPEKNVMSEETNTLKSGESKIKSDLETDLTTTTTPSPDFSNKLEKIIINKSDVNTLHDNQVSRTSKQEKINHTKDEIVIDPHLYERTVPTEDRKYDNGVQLSSPSPPNYNPIYKAIRSFESPPLVWIKRPSILPYASTYPRIESRRSYIPKTFFYGRIQPMPYIFRPRSPKWQISNALQNTLSISSAQQLDRIFFTTDYMNKIIPRAIPYPFYNRFQYL